MNETPNLQGYTSVPHFKPGNFVGALHIYMLKFGFQLWNLFLSKQLFYFTFLPWTTHQTLLTVIKTTLSNRWFCVDRLEDKLTFVNWALKVFHPTLGILLYSLPNFKVIITSFTQMPDKTDKGLIGMITNAFLLNKLKHTGHAKRPLK